MNNFQKEKNYIHNITYTNSKEKMQGISLLSGMRLFLAVFVILWLNSGSISYISNSLPDFIKLAAFVMWFSLACLNKKFMIKIVRIQLPIVIMLFLLLLCGHRSDNMYIEYMIINSIYAVAVSSIGLYYVQPTKRGEGKILLILLVTDTLYIAINTLLQLRLNPNLARYLSTGQSVRMEMLGSNLFYATGSFAHAYGFGIVIICLLYMILINKKHILQCMIGIALAFIFIIKTQFAIAFVLTVLLAGIITIYYTQLKSIGLRILLIVVIVVFLIIMIPNIGRLIQKIVLLDWMPYELSIRLSEVRYFLEGSSISSTDILVRFDLYNKSINSFFNNILFGSFGAGNIGEHSTWLDMLGLFGLFSIPYFVYFANLYREFKRTVCNVNKPMIVMVWIYYFVLGFLNTNAWAIILIFLFVFSPIYANTRENIND